MKIDYSRKDYTPKIIDSLMSRINRALTIEESYRRLDDKAIEAHGLNFNDIMSAFGGLLAQFIENVPVEQRGDIYLRFCDVLRMQAKIPLVERPPSTVPLN